MPTPDSLQMAHARLNAWRDRALGALVRGAVVPAVAHGSRRAAQADGRCSRSLSLDIDRWLMRLDHVRHGLCVHRGATIAQEPLAMQPAAARCAGCQAASHPAAQH